MTKHYVLTLTGSAQPLDSVLPFYSATQPYQEPTWSFLSLQGDGGNTHVIYVGGSVVCGNALTSSNYGFRMEAPATSIPPAPNIVELPFGGGSTIKLSEFQVLGTNTEKLHVFIKS